MARTRLHRCRRRRALQLCLPPRRLSWLRSMVCCPPPASWLDRRQEGWGARPPDRAVWFDGGAGCVRDRCVPSGRGWPGLAWHSCGPRRLQGPTLASATRPHTHCRCLLGAYTAGSWATCCARFAPHLAHAILLSGSHGTTRGCPLHRCIYSCVHGGCWAPWGFGCAGTSARCLCDAQSCRIPIHGVGARGGMSPRDSLCCLCPIGDLGTATLCVCGEIGRRHTVGCPLAPTDAAIVECDGSCEPMGNTCMPSPYPLQDSVGLSAHTIFFGLLAPTHSRRDELSDPVHTAIWF